MTVPLPEPAASADVERLLLEYLDFFRQKVAEKVADLPEDELRSSRLSSGWSPIELVKHLVSMERRWLVWGFLAEPVPEPWDDQLDGRWLVRPDESLDGILADLAAGGVRTRQIVTSHDLSAPGALGGRFTQESERPSLAAILFHVLQEYSRHLGHLDIARELIDGRTGE